MLVEFVGLPGCGKTTLTMDLEKRLCGEGYRAQGLRNAAKAAMAGMHSKVGFLRHRAERTNLYGAALYAQRNPALFDWVVRTSRTEFTALLWNLEALSQLGIVEQHCDSDVVILNDEGLIQRFAGNSFLDASQRQELEKVNDLLPADFLTIALTLPPELALARAKERSKGVPSGLRGASDAEVLAQFERYDGVLRQAVAARVDRGCPVLQLDASSEQHLLGDLAMLWLRPRLPAVPVAAQVVSGPPTAARGAKRQK